MTRTHFFRGTCLVVLGLTILAVPSAQPQSPAKIQPKLEPIAETKLLMEGLANVNFRGLERLLQQKPADLQTWTFARGQALLIAETANLLMLCSSPRSRKVKPCGSIAQWTRRRGSANGQDCRQSGLRQEQGDAGQSGGKSATGATRRLGFRPKSPRLTAAEKRSNSLTRPSRNVAARFQRAEPTHIVENVSPHLIA